MRRKRSNGVPNAESRSTRTPYRNARATFHILKLQTSRGNRSGTIHWGRPRIGERRTLMDVTRREFITGVGAAAFATAFPLGRAFAQTSSANARDRVILCNEDSNTLSV